MGWEGEGVMEVITRRLVVLSSVAKGASFLLTGGEVGIGREDDNVICLEDDLVSRHHAQLLRQNGEYILRDRNSMNGTFLNGQRMQEAILKVGDRIGIGQVEMGYEAVVIEPSTRSRDGKSGKPHTEPTTALASLRIRTAVANQPGVAAKNAETAHRPETFDLSRELDELRQAAEQLATLSKENRELAARLLAVEMRAVDERQDVESATAEIQRLETELAQARDEAQRMALLSGHDRQTGEAELLKRNEQVGTKLDAIGMALEEMCRLAKGDRRTELERALAEVAQLRSALESAAALRAPVTRLAQENEELRRALGKAHEELAVARRCLSDQTSEEFSRIRRNMLERNATATHTGLRGQFDSARRALHLQ
jgi:pSer/pThr/pTyr-binding forkhead associated (FHA) protein